MIQATPGRISQEFHDGHKAIDIANTVGTPVYAPEAGTVTHVGQLGPSGGTNDPGNVVQIGNETNGHRLCHLRDWTVNVGQYVAEGQLVGYMGHSGYVVPAGPAGAHLHWIMWRGGVRVRALNYITVARQTHTGGEDMIRREDMHIVRIISSEVKGWDFNHVHSGATDGREAGAWVGKPWTRLIEEGWREAEGWRHKRIAAIDYFDNRRPHLEAQLSNLQQTISQLQNTVANVTADDAADKQKIAEAVANITSLTGRLDGAHSTIHELQSILESSKASATSAPPAEPKVPEPSWLTRLLAALISWQKRKV